MHVMEARPLAARSLRGARARILVVAIAAVGALAGCPGSLEDPARFDSEFGIGDAGTGGSSPACPDIPTFLATTCGTAGCHSAASPQQNLDLVSPDVLTRLSGQSAMEGPGLLIDTSDPASSVLYLKMVSPPPFGSLMPLGGTPVSAANLACVLGWISGKP